MSEKRFSDPRLEAIRQTPHICLAEGLRAANRAIARRYDSYINDSGVGPAQLSLLMRLYYLGPTAMGQLAVQMETDRTTLTRTVKLLQDAGHVEVVPGESKRFRLVRMTEQGFSVLSQAIPKWEQAQADLRALLGDQSWATLLGETRHLLAVEGVACDRTARPTG